MPKININSNDGSAHSGKDSHQVISDELPTAAEVITSLNPDEHRSYFSLPHSDFELRILYFKSEYQFFICTYHKSAQHEEYQIRIKIENLLQIVGLLHFKAYAGNLQLYLNS